MTAGTDVEAARRDLVQAPGRFIERARGSAPDWRVIERVGTLALRQGKPVRAARLFAVAQARHEGVPGPVDPAERDLRAGDTGAQRRCALALALWNECTRREKKGEALALALRPPDIGYWSRPR